LTTGERVEEHVIFHIKVNNRQFHIKRLNVKLSGSQKNSTVLSAIPQGFDPSIEWSLKVNTLDFGSIMPYHMIIDQECKLVHAGSGLR
jgi:hypothetical protein